MHVVNTETNDHIEVEIRPVEKQDFSKISVRRYFFNWKEEKAYKVYKLMILGQEDILGLMSLDLIEAESRVEIRLLAVSSENRGANKRYDRITGCLIGFAARVAIRTYTVLPCLSLKPKTELRQYYKEKYYMKDGGNSVFSDGLNLVKLSVKYE